MPILPGLIALCLTLCACACNTAPTITPPLELLAPMQLPSRSNIKTNADLMRLLLEDERVIASKNSDLLLVLEFYGHAN